MNLPVRELFFIAPGDYGLEPVFQKKNKLFAGNCFPNVPGNQLSKSQSKLLLIHKIPPHSRRSLVIYAGRVAGPTVTDPMLPAFILTCFSILSSFRHLYTPVEEVETLRKTLGLSGRKPPDAGDMLAHCPGKFKNKKVTNEPLYSKTSIKRRSTVAAPICAAPAVP